jgi:hypothetical protein
MEAKINATQNVHLQEATINKIDKRAYHIGRGNRRRRGLGLDQGKERRRTWPLLYLVDGAVISDVIGGCTCQISASVPPAFAKGEEPNVPAINRDTINVASIS